MNEQTKPPFKLYWGPNMSSAGIQAVLEELALVYELEQVNFGDGEQKNDAYQALNPLAKVPTLGLPDGTLMTESAAMVIYLSEFQPAAGLMPAPGDPARPGALRWLLFLATEMYPAACRTYEPELFADDAAARQDVRGKAKDEFDRLLGILETSALEPGPYVLGERFSAVDIYLAMLLKWHPRPKRLPADFPRLKILLDRVTARPGVAKAFRRHELLGEVD